MSNKKFRILLCPPVLTGKELNFLSDSLSAGYLAPSGPENRSFERKLAEFTGARHLLTTSSGSSALHLAYLCAGLERGDEVWCSDLTFYASASPALMLGLKPVFLDADPDTYCLDVRLLEDELITANRQNKLPKAIIATHLFGNPIDLFKIRSLTEQHGIIFIEDAAESLGSTIKGVHTGTIGDFAVLSFNGNKIITTTSGGAFICRDKEHLRQAEKLANQGRLPGKAYVHDEPGYNYQMSNMLASIGLAQFTEIEERVQLKRNIFRQYESCLGKIEGISLQKEYPGALSNRWLNTIVFDKSIYPDDICFTISELLEEEGVETRPIWKPMHLQPVFSGSSFKGAGVSENLEKRGLCLPSGINLTKVEIEEVSGLITRAIKKG